MDDFLSDPVEVWPENWTTVTLFCDMNTQWRTGMAGATGLDYNVLFRLLDEAGLTGADWRETLDSIRTMEIESLEQMRK